MGERGQQAVFIFVNGDFEELRWFHDELVARAFCHGINYAANKGSCDVSAYLWPHDRDEMLDVVPRCARIDAQVALDEARKD